MNQTGVRLKQETPFLLRFLGQGIRSRPELAPRLDFFVQPVKNHICEK